MNGLSCRLVLDQLDGTDRLIGELLVREGKGNKDRVTMLPNCAIPPLRGHIERVRALHEKDLADGFGRVYLPTALERKYPNAASEFRWQFVFPSAKVSKDPRTEVMRRHHAHEAAVSREVTAAVRRAGLDKRATLVCAADTGRANASVMDLKTFRGVPGKIRFGDRLRVRKLITCSAKRRATCQQP